MEYVADIHHIPDRACRDAQEASGCETSFVQTARRPRADPAYFVTKCLVGAIVLSGAAGEIENVNQAFQPDGRFAASNSP